MLGGSIPICGSYMHPILPLTKIIIYLTVTLKFLSEVEDHHILTGREQN
jgi:hypothetical protein